MLSAGAVVALCGAGQAHAQTADAPPADDAATAPGDAIVVTGYRQSIEKSLEQKRESNRTEEHTSELQSLMRISYAVFCLKQKTRKTHYHHQLLPEPAIQ